MAWAGKSQVIRAIEDLKARLLVAAEGAVTDGSILLQNQQQQNASHRPGPNVRTGSLRRGILLILTKQVGRGVFSGGTKATVIYSRIQELGGTIYPKRGMFLVWTDGPRPVTPEGWRAAQKAGLVHRARQVTLPARPYMRPGIAEVAPQYQELTRKRLGAAIMGT